MEWQLLISDMLDTRAFDSLWYWILLGVLWALVTQRALGVPWDLVQRGRASGDDGAAELDAVVHLFAHRALDLSDRGAQIMLAVACFALTVLAVVGFVYGAELGQALFILAAPLFAVGPLNMLTARQIVGGHLRGPDLWKALGRYRVMLHALAGVAILSAAGWSLFQDWLAMARMG